MNRQPVSIVIPTYQRAETIGRTLKSLADAPPQHPYEVIVVDNASTDGTEDIVAKMFDAIGNLHFYRWEENLGPLENWRRGIERAQGHWLKILWSDDGVDPGAIDRLVSVAETEGFSTVTCGVRLQYRGRDINWYPDPVSSLEPETVVDGLLRLPAALPVSPTAALVRREQALHGLRSVQIPEACATSAIGPDVVLTYWDVFNGAAGVHIGEPLVNFGSPEDSITVSTRPGKLFGCYASSMWALLTSTDSRLSDETMRRLRHRGWLAGLLRADHGTVPESRRFSLATAAGDLAGITRFELSAMRKTRQ
jgi:glycosyltransferase involved in cell wall biosynthesis